MLVILAQILLNFGLNDAHPAIAGCSFTNHLAGRF
jgi:hypothetical protein